MQPPPLAAGEPGPNAHAQPDVYRVPPPLDEGGEEILHGAHNLSVEKVLHSVHSEPEHGDSARSTQLAELIAYKRGSGGPVTLAAILLLSLLMAGPVAVLGTFIGAQQGYVGGIYLCVVGPVVEEMMKIAVLLFLLERKPWYILSGATIYIVAGVSGVMFGVIENMIYQYIYLAKVADAVRLGIMEFRWTVTVLLHGLTTLVAGYGLHRAWRATIARGRLFDSGIAEPFIGAGIVIHGLYNLAVGVVFRDVFERF